MSKLSHLGIGLALCVFCLVCLGLGYVAFIGTAISKDSVPGASVFNSGFIIIYVVFGGLILGGLWLAFLSFRRVFAAPPRSTREPAVMAEQKTSAVPSHGTPDDKLAHMVKRPQ